MKNLKEVFIKIKTNNPNMSLDEVLYAVYDEVKDEYNKPFDVLRNMILEENNIDELECCTKNVRQDLKDYINEHIFPVICNIKFCLLYKKISSCFVK